MEPWNLKDLDHFKIIVWLILENTILSWQFSFWYDPTVGTLGISGIAVPLVYNLASPQQPELQTLISGGPSSIVWPLCVFWSPSIFVDPGSPLLISCNYFNWIIAITAITTLHSLDSFQPLPPLLLFLQRSFPPQPLTSALCHHCSPSFPQPFFI